MIIAFAWYFSALALILVLAGLFLKESTFMFAGSSLFLILGLTILAYGMEYESQKTISITNNFQNMTQFNAAENSTRVWYNLINSTTNETTHFIAKQDNQTFSLGLVYSLMGIFLMVWTFIQKKTIDQLRKLPKTEYE